MREREKGESLACAASLLRLRRQTSFIADVNNGKTLLYRAVCVYRRYSVDLYSSFMLYLQVSRAAEMAPLRLVYRPHAEERRPGLVLLTDKHKSTQTGTTMTANHKSGDTF